MNTIKIDDPFEKIVSLGSQRKPLRIKIHEQQFILLPDMPDDILEKLEIFLEDHLDEFDNNLKNEVAEGREQIAKGDFLSHENIWPKTK